MAPFRRHKIFMNSSAGGSWGPWSARLAICAAISCTGALAATGSSTPALVSGPSPAGRPHVHPVAVAAAPASGTPGLPGAALAAASGLRRLSVREYDNSLQYLLGDRTRPGARLLTDDPRRPFDNDATLQVPSNALVEGLDFLAREAARRLLSDPARRDTVVGCKPAGPGDGACFKTFVVNFGRRALRRSLNADEVNRFLALLALGTESSDFYVAVETALVAFLQHFDFAYRVELGTPVPGQPALFRLTPHETASRLSFFLWGAPPDDALLDLADKDALSSTDDLRIAATRMLKDPRARELLGRFFAMWLGYESLPFAPDLVTGMKAENAALLNRVIFTERRPWRDLFRMDETYVNADLAKHYGLVSAATLGTNRQWVKYGDGRAGLLSQGGFLSIGAKFEDTSPTLRGVSVRERLLCEDIPPPPPGVDTDIAPGSNKTDCKEARYDEHASGSCARCHELIDPIGFGLERFDALGRPRTKEAKNKSCTIRGEGEVEGLGTFRGPGELGSLLAKSGRLEPCLVQQIYRFALGRHDFDPTDLALIAIMTKRASAAGDTLRFDDIILDLVSAEAFRHRREETAVLVKGEK